MNSSIYVLIIAGGAGTRFWPASREKLPKQFLDITGSGKTLIRETVDRFTGFIPKENMYVITHKQYGNLVAESLPELSANQVLLEPSRNNTAPAIAYGVMKLSAIDPDGICIVAPADHVIKDESEFERVIKLAIEFAGSNECLITLGIKPSRPDTGYGYIDLDPNEKGDVRKVVRFREKPDAKTAKQFLESDSFIWNTGINVFKISDMLKAYAQHANQIYNILIQGQQYYNTLLEQEFIDTKYAETEKIAVDVAILERANNVYAVPCDIGWSDLGTWNSLYEYSEKDTAGNALLTKPVRVDDTHNNLVLSQNEKLVVIKGLENFIVIDTPDCLLIYPKSDEQEIKTLKDKLKERGFDAYL